MVEKSFALQSPRLSEDELELQVPSHFIAGRLGGAHPGLESIAGPSPASRLEWISVGESLCWFWGCPAARPGLAFSLCPSVSFSLVLGRCVRGPVPRIGSAPAVPLPLLICAAERRFRAAAFEGGVEVVEEGWRHVENARMAFSALGHRLRSRAGGTTPGSMPLPTTPLQGSQEKKWG